MKSTPVVHRSPREPLVLLCSTTGLWDGQPVRQAELHVASPIGPQQDLQCAECCSLSRASLVYLQLWKAGFAKSKTEGNPERSKREADCCIIKCMHSNSRSQTLQVTKLAQPWDLFLKPILPSSFFLLHVQNVFSRLSLQSPAET